MNATELEAALRTLWTKSQVPFDRKNLVAYTGLDEKRLNRTLTQLVKSGQLGVESVDGEVEWTMPIGSRPFEGPETLERHLRLEKMRADVKTQVRAKALARRTGTPLENIGTPDDEDQDASDAEQGERDGSILRTGGRAAKGAISLVSRAAGKLDRKATGGKKNLVASAGLSLFGPLGWLYAGSFREAVPAAALFAFFFWLLPSPLLWPILFFALPVSALTGAAYAWQYNRAGERRPLLLSRPDDESD